LNSEHQLPKLAAYQVSPLPLRKKIEEEKIKKSNLAVGFFHKHIRLAEFPEEKTVTAIKVYGRV
jgi:hypothetical protein